MWRVVDENGIAVSTVCTERTAKQMVRRHNYESWLFFRDR